MTRSHSSSVEHPEIRARFEAYADGALPDAETEEIENHLLSCSDCEAAFEQFQRQQTGLSGLHKMSAPIELSRGVAETINRRSQGRFFGRRAFGDRVPLPLLAGLVFAALIGLYYFIWSSDTGSLKLDDRPAERTIDDPIDMPAP